MTDEPDSWYWERTWNDYRRGNTQVKLRWSDGDATATIFDLGAPLTARAFLERLPMQVPVVHAAWSGEMVMSTGTHPLGIPDHENRVRLVRVGDLAYDPKFDEITVTYGTAEARLPDGPNTLTVFGQISDGLNGFASFGRRCRFQGIQTITFDALGSAT